jgi:hypothetical protein
VVYEDPDDVETIRSIPADAPKPLSHEDRVHLFGALKWKPLPGGKPGEIALDPVWVKQNLVTIRIPYAGVSTSGLSPETRAITVHKLAAKPMLALWEAWRDSGMLPLIRTFNGCWVPRMKRGHEQSTRVIDLSNHSWGTAFDVNAPWNKLGERGARLGQTGSVELLVPLALEHGFAWGGYFSRPDSMHFELAELRG